MPKQIEQISPTHPTQPSDGMFHDHPKVRARAEARLEAMKEPRLKRAAKFAGEIAAAAFLRFNDHASEGAAVMARDLSRAHATKGEYLTTSVAPRLQKKYESRNNASDQRLHKRMGTYAVGKAAKLSKASGHASQAKALRYQKMAENEAANRGGGRLTQIAQRYLNRRDAEARNRYNQRNEVYGEESQRFQQENPDAMAAYEAHISRQKASSVLNATQRSRESAVEYAARGSASSFLKSVPRYEDIKDETEKAAVYQASARTALEKMVATQQPEKDEPFVLMSADASRGRRQAAEAQGVSALKAAQAESDMQDGLNTSVWKLGFIETGDDGEVGYGGKFAKDVEWGYGKNNTRTARIPLDPSNELHQLVAGDRIGQPHQYLELAMPGDYNSIKNDPYMTLGVVETGPVGAAA